MLLNLQVNVQINIFLTASKMTRIFLTGSQENKLTNPEIKLVWTFEKLLILKIKLAWKIEHFSLVDNKSLWKLIHLWWKDNVVFGEKISSSRTPSYYLVAAYFFLQLVVTLMERMYLISIHHSENTKITSIFRQNFEWFQFLISICFQQLKETSILMNEKFSHILIK